MKTAFQFLLAAIIALLISSFVRAGTELNPATEIAIETVRAQLDPLVLPMTGIEGSMIGGCVAGTDKDPFEAVPVPSDSQAPQEDKPVDLCLVYLVTPGVEIAPVEAEFKKLNFKSPFAVRFQKGFGPMQ